MRDGLRIRLRNSQRLRMLQRTSRLVCLFCVLAGMLGNQLSMVPAALGLLLLTRSLHRLDPRGLTLLKGQLGEPGGEWSIVNPGDPRIRLCTLKSQGNVSSLLWLEVYLHPRSQRKKRYRSLLIFPDALSFEQWRLLRRELRLDNHKGAAAS